MAWERGENMKTKNAAATLISMMTAVLFVFALAGITIAQGRYANQYSRADVDTIIRNVEDRADEFRRDFYAELERSNLGGSQERVYRNQVTDFENATDRLRRNFDSDNNWWQSRNQVQNVIANSRPLNTTMNSIAFRRRIERQWNQLRNAVNRLADTYDLPGIAGGGWNGGPWNPGNPGGGDQGPTSRPPSWAVGTFYSGGYDNITLTINANGRVTVVNNGQTYYGRYNNGRMHLNNDTSTISRTRDGIRTYNLNSRQTTDYSRNSYGGGGGGDDAGGPTSNPPSWARGTFYSANSYDNISLTINANGRVTVVNNGQAYYGRYYNGQIYLNNDVSDVARDGNGIRTYNRSNGQTTVYRRR